MKLHSYIDLTSDKTDSIGILGTSKGAHLNIVKGGVSFDIDISKLQMYKLKKFFDTQTGLDKYDDKRE